MTASTGGAGWSRGVGVLGDCSDTPRRLPDSATRTATTYHWRILPGAHTLTRLRRATRAALGPRQTTERTLRADHACSPASTAPDLSCVRLSGTYAPV